MIASSRQLPTPSAMYAVCGAWAPSLRNTAAELAVGFAVAVVVTDSVTVTAAVCLVVGAAAAGTLVRVIDT